MLNYVKIVLLYQLYILYLIQKTETEYKPKPTKMSYKWRPSATARREFAEKMNNDSEFTNAYYARKEAREQKRRSQSNFDYQTAGGNYVPTKAQYDFCFDNMHLFATSEEENAANMVMYGYTCQEKVSHDSIHIVNELMRNSLNY